MATEEEEVVVAARRLYDAIEVMVKGGGLEPMSAAWHHIDSVSSKHPSGEWAHGWEEVWATWRVFAAFGRPERGGSKLLSIRAHLWGDIASTTAVFQTGPFWGREKLMCTNVLQRIEGAWKVIHHHADPAPAMARVLEGLAPDE